MAKTVNLRTASEVALRERKAILLKGIQVPQDAIRASSVRQFLTCGKSNCRCKRGFKHGPFFYLVRCVPGGKIRKFLLKTPALREQARAAVEAHGIFQNQLAELSGINAELLRRGRPLAERSG